MTKENYEDEGEYIGISKAAKLTGYNPEYIRQLIRAKKVVAKKIVTVWVVSKSSLLAHKASKQ